MYNIRPPAVAGQFYPDNPLELKQMISRFINEAGIEKTEKKLKALIVPHAGYNFSGPVAAYGYKLIQENQLKQSRVFLLGPSHNFDVKKPVVCSFDYWQTPLGKILAQSQNLNLETFDEAHLGEHSLEVQLPFLQTVLKDFTISPILLNYYEKGLVLALSRLIDESGLIIVSSDLSHYRPYNQAVTIDALANKFIPQLNFEQTGKIEACGLAGILTLIKVAQNKDWQGKLLNYQNSGDTFGDKERVVGYGAYGFFE